MHWDGARRLRGHWGRWSGSSSPRITNLRRAGREVGGDVEVRQPPHAVAGDEDVGGLDVAVQDPEPVQVGHGLHDVDEDAPHGHARGLAVADPVVEGAAAVPRHLEVERPVRLENGLHLSTAGRRKARSGTRTWAWAGQREYAEARAGAGAEAGAGGVALGPRRASPHPGTAFFGSH